MKIAICYWGMTRSTKFVYKSHINHLFNILNVNNIEYDVFMHTWKTKNDENIIWEKPCSIPIDYEEHKLLNPDYYKIENQNDFTETLNFSDYFNEKLYKLYGGDRPYEWRPQLILNHLCALESQKRVYNMVVETKNNYDFIIYIRPDVELFNNFEISWFNSDFDIVLLDYNHYEGFNDRFAILHMKTAAKYSERIDEIKDFRQNHGRIVSEKYVKFIVEKYYSNPKFVNFLMKIVRPNGQYA
jgi:hypothetical protein